MQRKLSKEDYLRTRKQALEKTSTEIIVLILNYLLH